MNEKEQLAKLLSAMSYKFVVAYGKILDSDLSGSQVYMMQLLQTEGPKKSSELAELLEISLPAITNLAGKLVRKGYIERNIPEHDRRVTMLQITAKGSEVLDKINDKYAALTDAFWDGFTQEELSQLLNFNQRMYQNLIRSKE